MKKTFSLFLTVLLLLSVAGAALADTWYCPDCGHQNDSKFCSECGAKRPDSSASSTSSGTITNITCSQTDNGDTMVRWSSSSDGPFTLTYKLSYWKGDWYEKNSYSSTFAQLLYLIPGTTYTITIKNSNTGDSASTEYTVPDPIFRDYSTGNKFVKLSKSKFHISEEKKNPLDTFKLSVSWPQLSHSRNYQSKLVMETPLGYNPRVIVNSEFTFENRYSSRYWNFSMYNDWLSTVENEFGEIPTGSYTFRLYMDGDLYDYASFTLYN